MLFVVSFEGGQVAKEYLKLIGQPAGGYEISIVSHSVRFSTPVFNVIGCL